MYSSKPRNHRGDKPRKSKKGKKLSNLINRSDSDTGNESEHELSYYMEDRVKLMKEVLKIIKPKKIKTMTPDCMKRMQIEEVNSMLLEELLGISNKRLRYIFDGKSLDEESSTDEDQPVDVISLDDISDDDFVIISDEETDKHSKKHKRRKIKVELKEKSKKIKKEKPDKVKGKDRDKTKEKEKEKTNSKDKEPMGEENLMSVLELLELQARARAIRSQLELESKRKKEEQERVDKEKADKALQNGQEDDEEIIMEVPKEIEIIITSSDSENEVKKKDKNKASTSKEKITTNSNSSIVPISDENIDSYNKQIENPSQGIKDSALLINDKGKANNESLVNKEKILESVSNENRNDKEDGEVSDDETLEKENTCDRGELSTIPVPPGVRSKIDGNVTASTTNQDTDSDSSGSGSDSSDNLQVIMLREKRKKKRTFEKLDSGSTVKNNNKENGEAKDSSLEIAEAEDDSNINEDEPVIGKNSEENKESSKNHESNDPKTSDRQVESQNDNPQGESQIETAIADFLKTQPPPSPQTEELRLQEEEAKKNEQKAQQTKEKRLKKLKNKLQSYKKDVEGESSVTILENIVIKPQAVDRIKPKNKVSEDSDDLVINVDQDDLDCIVCD